MKPSHGVIPGRQSTRIAFYRDETQRRLVERKNYADVPDEEAVDEVLETLVVSAELLAVTVTMTTDEDGDEVLELETLVVSVA